MDKINIIYDATVLLNDFDKNSSRSGIFWVAYNVLKELSKKTEFKIYLYCENSKNILLKQLILKNKSDFGNCTILEEYNYNFINKVYNTLINKINKYKLEKKKIKKKLLNPFVGFFKILSNMQNFIFNKIYLDKILTNTNIFISPVYEIPQFIQKQKNINCYTILYDTIPLIFPDYYPSACKGGHWFINLINSSFNSDKRSNFFAISQSAKNDFIKYVPSIKENKITVMPIATAQDFYPDKNEEKLKKVLDKYNVSKNQRGKYIFSLCTLEPRKNLIFTIKCFIEFIKENNINDLYFYLGGGHWEDFIGQLEKEIDDLDKYKDKIVKLGYVDDEDVNTLYSNSLFFTYVSLYEGFGMPPLEAMSCGTPVLTSNTSSLPEVVGDAAIMIDPTDKKACIDAMKDLYFNENLRNELSKKGLEQAKKFNWEKTVDIIVNNIKRNDD